MKQAEQLNTHALLIKAWLRYNLSRRLALHMIGLLLASLLALWPSWAAAECGPLDVGGCVDGAMYSFWEGVAGFGWWIDRTLLMGAYQIDTLRWWLVEVAFSSAYQALTTTLSPMLAPIATTAIVIGCLFFLLVPILGHTSVVSIRHALIWAVLGPVLMTISGPLVTQVEQARSQVGSVLYDAVSAIAPGAIFGAPGSDMRSPTLLYPSSPCGVALIRRSGTGLRLDDLAAALVWADAGDIHCPEVRGPSRDIPDGFYEAAPSGAGYAVDSDVSLMPPGTPRSEAVRNMQRGAIRTFVTIIPSLLAVLDNLVQLIFALCLVALWISLPIGLLFVYFQHNAGVVTGLFRRMLLVLQVSWSTSVLMGLVVACLVAAAQLRNAAAYTGFAIGGGALVLYLVRVAVDTFVDALRTISSTAATITGLSAAQAVTSTMTTLTSVGATGAALVSGGAAAGLVAAAAYQQSGSGSYATAAALGRLQPLAEVGEVAAAFGLIDAEGEIASGLYAGSRSERSFRMAARQFRSDAKRTNQEGLTFRERAVERGVARRLAADSRPTITEEVSQAVDSALRVTSYVGSAQMAEDVWQLGERIPTVATVTDGWERMRTEWHTVQEQAREQYGATNPLAMTAASIQILDQRVRPGGPRRVAYLDAHGRVAYQPAPQQSPSRALHAPAAQTNIPRLLTLGYVVHDQGEQVTFWRQDRQSDTEQRSTHSSRPEARGNTGIRRIGLDRTAMPTRTPERDADTERAQLVRAGAMLAAAASAQPSMVKAPSTAATCREVPISRPDRNQPPSGATTRDQMESELSDEENSHSDVAIDSTFQNDAPVILEAHSQSEQEQPAFEPPSPPLPEADDAREVRDVA